MDIEVTAEGWLFDLVEPFLQQAEARYGAKVPGWRFRGIGFHTTGPQTCFAVEPGQRVIILSPGSESHRDCARYELAHEVVHLLGPRGDEENGTVLEEGAAVHFSLTAPSFDDHGYSARARASLGDNYRNALADFEALTAIAPDAVKLLRSQQPIFAEITPELIRRCLPDVPQSLAKRLCVAHAMRPGS